MIKKIIKKGFEILGYKIQKTDIRSNFTMFDALKRCVNRGLEIKTVIDIGASDGSWSRECLKFLPAAQYLLIEAQEPHKIGLEKLQKEKKNVNFILAAAGNKEGKIFFENSRLLGGLASETPFDKNCIEVPEVKVDNEIFKRRLEGPYLIKMDTHGFEIPIIEGALETLKHSELVIIETYNYQLTKDSLKFYQMCDYMEKKGFLPIDIIDLTLRKYDNSFWQMDIYFVPKGREEFKYNSYE